MAQVLDIFLVDELTGEVIPMAEDPEKKKKKKWLGLLLPVGLFVIGFFEVIFTGGGGYRVTRIEIKYINPNTQRQL